MIHVIIGTRAQLIKMVPLMHLMQERGIEYNFIFMAQHHDTIYEILREFGLKAPDSVLCDTGTDIVSAKKMAMWSIKVLFEGIRRRAEIFRGDKNGIVLIHGDAPPLLLGAVIAWFQGISVGSVEAGLRSFNLLKPFPEELTRVLTSRLGLVHVYFCQDQTALDNLSKVKGEKIHTRGNTIVDAIQLATEINRDRPDPSANMDGDGAAEADERFAIVTLHRFETISNRERFQRIIELVIGVSKKVPVRFILHPPTAAALKKFDLYRQLDQQDTVTLLPRMSFLDFNRVLVKTQFIITDGGSNQEESAFLGIPCLLFRTETERREGLGENVVLSKLDPAVIDDFLDHYESYRRPVDFGGTSPSDIILSQLDRYRG